MNNFEIKNLANSKNNLVKALNLSNFDINNDNKPYLWKICLIFETVIAFYNLDIDLKTFNISFKNKILDIQLWKSICTRYFLKNYTDFGFIDNIFSKIFEGINLTEYYKLEEIIKNEKIFNNIKKENCKESIEVMKNFIKKFDDKIFEYSRCKICNDLIPINYSYCLDCNSIEQNVKSNFKQNLSTRGYKIYSNGEVDPFLNYYRFYNKDKKCSICKNETNNQLSTNDDKFPNLDHKIPIIKGGKYIFSNSQILCRKCNVINKRANIDETILQNYLNNEFLKETSDKYIEKYRNLNSLKLNGFINQDNLNLFIENNCENIYEKCLFNIEQIKEQANLIKGKYKDFDKILDKFNKIYGFFAYTDNIDNKCLNIYDVIYILDEIDDKVVENFNKRINLYNSEYCKNMSLFRLLEDNTVEIIAGNLNGKKIDHIINNHSKNE